VYEIYGGLGVGENPYLLIILLPAIDDFKCSSYCENFCASFENFICFKRERRN
jgi:hypothetical protein